MMDALWQLDWCTADSDSDDVTECLLCFKAVKGCLRQVPYAVCWQCWTLASWRCWWQFKASYPEPAAELMHRFVFGEWSVMDLSFRADEKVSIDLDSLCRFQQDSDLDHALRRLQKLRPVFLWSLWPSSQFYVLRHKQPILDDFRDSLVWEGGAVSQSAQSLLSVLGTSDLGKLSQKLQEALVSLRKTGSFVRFTQGTHCFVGKVDPFLPHGFMQFLDALLEPFQDKLNCVQSGGFFRIGTSPVVWPSDHSEYWLTCIHRVKEKEKPLHDFHGSSGLLRQLHSLFPI